MDGGQRGTGSLDAPINLNKDEVKWFVKEFQN